MKAFIFICALTVLQALGASEAASSSDKILCLLLVPETRNDTTFANATYTSWGKECNRTVVAGLNIKEENSQNFTIFKLKTVPGKGGNVEALNRTFNDFKKDFEEKKYGWISVTLDSTFVLMKNLREFVKKQDSEKILYFGDNQGYNNTFDAKNYTYMQIKAGYVISWPALQKLSEVLKYGKTVPNCVFATDEYVNIGKCMKHLTAETVNTYIKKDNVEYRTFWNMTFEEAKKDYPAMKVADHRASSISFSVNSTDELKKTAEAINFGTMPSLSISLLFTTTVVFFTRMFY